MIDWERELQKISLPTVIYAIISLIITQIVKMMHVICFLLDVMIVIKNYWAVVVLNARKYISFLLRIREKLENSFQKDLKINFVHVSNRKIILYKSIEY